MKFLRYFLFIQIFSLLIGCNNKQTKKNELNIHTNIKGLTKGTIYLEKVIDTTIKIVDSTVINHSGKFVVGDNIDSPEIYYLRLKEIPNESILIFAEKGEINVDTKLEKFETSAKVTGSTNHDLLMDYKKMIQQFNDKRLDIFKANFEAEQEHNQQKLDSLDKLYKSLIRKRYLYTTNYAVSHANKEVAPYLALTELYNANIRLLDTVNNSLTDDIKDSKYGKQLQNFITVIKKNESNYSSEGEPTGEMLLNN